MRVQEECPGVGRLNLARRRPRLLDQVGLTKEQGSSRRMVVSTSTYDKQVPPDFAELVRFTWVSLESQHLNQVWLVCARKPPSAHTSL